jgi:hypothetical protein
MLSAPGYKRNYKEEWKDAKARGEGADNAQRHRARYEMEKAGKVHKNDGVDVGHKTAIKRGGSNAPSNLKVQSVAENRSFARSKDGSMKSETSRREKK